MSGGQAAAEWQRFRAAALHLRTLNERGEDEDVVRAQEHVVGARYREFRAAFAGKPLPAPADGDTATLLRFPPPPGEPEPDKRSSRRLMAIHRNRLKLGELPDGDGSPDEWLATAILHLKIATSGPEQRSVQVSAAALHLLLMRHEQIECGGQPWEGNAA